MLSIKEIDKIAGDTYPQTDEMPHAQPVFDQAKAYVSLVEKIKAVEDNPGMILCEDFTLGYEDGYNKCLAEIKSFISEI